MARFVALLTAVLAAVSPTFALWPIPKSIESGSTTLTLASGFNIKLDVKSAPKDLRDAVSRTEDQIKSDKLGRLIVGRGASDAKSISEAKSKGLKSLVVTLAGGASATSISDEAVKPLTKRDEAYQLVVPANGDAATLTAKTSLGLLRGLTTFSQLWYTYNGQIYTAEAPFKIDDAPAYPYRGYMLDTARNYFPISDIKRVLDTMSLVKMSQFHWHIVDSQSFPFVIPGFEKISEKGAYSEDEKYSASDVADIVAYAAARGIDVVAEIDTPGHTAIIAESYPEHIACPYAKSWATHANEPPPGQLRLASPKTSKFAADLLGAAAKLFKSSMFSSGGDEINMLCYKEDVETQQALNASGKTFEQALDAFTQESHASLRKQGKSAVVWEEMVLVHNVTLAKDTNVLVWLSADNAKAVAQKSFGIIHAASDYFYLDCGGGGWVGDFPAGNSWCDPFHTWQRAYTFNPVANLTAEESAFVRGGQALLWTEQSGPENLDPVTWPRAAASAELFWSGPARTNVSSALPRLHDIAYRMRKRGVKAIALQPQWCALRPNACDLTA